MASVSAPYRFLVNDSVMGYDWSYRHPGQAAVSQRASQLSVDYVVAAVAGLRTSYRIDKVYLMGFSQGEPSRISPHPPIPRLLTA